MRQSATCRSTQLRATPRAACAPLSHHISSVTRLVPPSHLHICTSPPLAAVSQPHYGHFPAPFMRRFYSADDQRVKDVKKVPPAPMEKGREEEVVIRLRV